MDLKKIIPWWLKFSLKLILSLLPINYSSWRRLGIFKHGTMNEPSLAISTFQKYYKIANEYKKIPNNFNCLEIGPGDSILTGLAAKSFGSNYYWAIDNGQFADMSLQLYKNTAKYLHLKNKNLYKASSTLEFFKNLNLKYKTEGLKSLKEIPSSSIDFCWSQVVLEHIYLDEIDELIGQIHRTLKKNSYSLHSIDFRDHLGDSLNNLRFKKSFWETELIQKGGFYTNRIRPSKMLKIFQKNGFDIKILEKQKWEKIPIKKEKLSIDFLNCKEDDLLISEFLLLTRTKK